MTAVLVKPNKTGQLPDIAFASTTAALPLLEVARVPN
jgi:hypothetical protein